MRALRNILTGLYYMLFCQCCGEPVGSACDVYCKLDGCPDGCLILS